MAMTGHDETLLTVKENDSFRIFEDVSVPDAKAVIWKQSMVALKKTAPTKILQLGPSKVPQPKPQLTKQQSTVSSLPARMAPARGSLNMITCAMKDEHLKQRNDDNFCGQRSFWRIGKNSLFFVAISICSTVSWWEGKHKAFRFWVMHGFNRSRMFIKLRWIKQHHHSTSWDSHVTHIPSQDYELLQIINELWIHRNPNANIKLLLSITSWSQLIIWSP